MKVLVTGSRQWLDGAYIREVLSALPKGTVLVHGACPYGADALANRVGKELGMAIRRYPANWGMYGKAAGHIRNQAMIDAEHPYDDGNHIDMAFAFPTASSRGTWDCVQRLHVAGIGVRIIKER